MDEIRKILSSERTAEDIELTRNMYITIPIGELFVNPSNRQSNKIRRRLLYENLKEYRCERCKLTEWNGDPIPLELSHVDGNKFNNLLSNLELICPNCHAQTESYRGKNIGSYDQPP